MTDILRIPNVISVPAENRYALIGLRQNPFPNEPSIRLGNQDPRLNGSIYNQLLHEGQRKQFDSFLIPTVDKPDVRTLIFLMDHATRRGRGIGKTVFLKKQVDRIMSDFGESASRGYAVMFGVHVVPSASPPTTKFWQFARIIFDSFLETDIIAIAIARLRALSTKIRPELLAEIKTTEDLIEKLGNDHWLNEKRVPVDFELNPAVEQILRSSGVRDELARALANYGTSQEKFRQAFYDSFTNYRWRQDGGKIVFHDLVNLFLAAKFNRALLLIDEVEKIVPVQNLLERRAFVDSLRYFMFDGQCASANNRFFGMLLTIHPGLQELLLPHWNAAGLDRLAPINEPDAQRNTIYFPPLNARDAKPLVTEYLDYYRLPGAKFTELMPFDEDAIVEALVQSSGVPGKMLTLLSGVVDRAVELGITKINKQFVHQTYFQEAKAEPPVTENATPTSNPQTDLTGA